VHSHAADHNGRGAHAGFREARHLARSRAGRVLIAAVVAIALATVIALVALWPPGDASRASSDATTPATIPAHVIRVIDGSCGGPVAQRCRTLKISVDGRRSTMTLGPVSVAGGVHAGDTVRVAKVTYPAGTPHAAAAEPYVYADVDRQRSVTLLAASLALLALLALRWRGLLAVLGVGLSLLLLTQFVVPALLAGRPAIAVALTGSLAVMFVTLVLTNGIGAQTLAAALGISATLLLTCLLAAFAANLTRLDGRVNEVATTLMTRSPGLSLQGVVIAGMVIGALGVLADTAVTQASAVMALRRADPRLPGRALYHRALAIGRDHLSATIHTLVLAYAGTTLSLLLALRATSTTVPDGLNFQDTAEPIVAAVTGCAALITAVPLTTGLAALLIARVPAQLIPPHGHSHPN
jgi:uncharacterized membrane protein